MSTTSSLVDLPTELLVEIVSYYPHPHEFLSPLLRHEHGLQERKDRQQVLRSLSQTCGVLRRLFLPALWERLEVSKGSLLREEAVSSEVSTSLLSYVKSIHVSTAEWPASDIEPIFLLVNLLKALPNVTGLQIYHNIAWELVAAFAYAFAEASFPSITELAVPDVLEQMFPSFPNVKTLACPAIYAHSRVLSPAQQYFPHLEGISGLRLSKMLINQVRQHLPKLRAISVSSVVPPEDSDGRSHNHQPVEDDEDCRPMFTDLALLRDFKHLEELSLIYACAERDALSLPALISAGKDVLQHTSSKTFNKKLLRVWDWDWSKGFDVHPRVVYLEATV
ncbi:hypothetical protein FB45DRAFT_1063683 [Roridomyces roridus]|uniref:F-box domain-containing protein n=1 Tax=Roridomyces roridus TaxID=1738132 RepID=A0AAD7BD90_9AGAR|nr:hypothetical protein FB45DRAFT_1063683 [Roridomyces roridus]